jgi:hypothetical protein
MEQKGDLIASFLNVSSDEASVCSSRDTSVTLNSQSGKLDNKEE